MGSVTFEIFRKAIEAKQQIRCNYQGHGRSVCPHAVGYSKTGDEMALTYQFAGGSSKGLPPEGQWRCLELGSVSHIQVQDGEWHTGQSHRRPQTCVHCVVAEVAY